MPIPGHATAQGTAAFKQRCRDCVAEHFRYGLDHLTLSSLGIGTYLGPRDAATDDTYRASVREALRLGVNVIDTAINYRLQSSEKAVGQALQEALAVAEICREEVVVATKGGFLPFPPGEFARLYLDGGLCQPEDLVANCHCLAPAFLLDQIKRSLTNLGLAKIDIYYLHNPEIQLEELGRKTFLARLKKAFEAMEQAVAKGLIGVYGVASWNGFREDGERLHTLDEILACAQEAGGKLHHFKVVQLPVNLAMPEALLKANHRLNERQVTFLETARANDITVMASGSILQARLAASLPPIIPETFPNLRTDAQRALQFTRSVPGVATALVGMSQSAHVRENLELRQIPLASADVLQKLFVAR